MGMSKALAVAGENITAATNNFAIMELWQT
jgi:hypothetical protein